jgi:hypothetical protein
VKTVEDPSAGRARAVALAIRTEKRRREEERRLVERALGGPGEQKASR